jgi:hypothetical protein
VGFTVPRGALVACCRFRPLNITTGLGETSSPYESRRKTSFLTRLRSLDWLWAMAGKGQEEPFRMRKLSDREGSSAAV